MISGPCSVLFEERNGSLCDLHRKSSEEGLDQEFNSLQGQRITRAILDGRQPAGLTADKLLAHSRLPLAWHEQCIVLGFA
jgi:hypothetical protein